MFRALLVENADSGVKAGVQELDESTLPTGSQGFQSIACSVR